MEKMGELRNGNFTEETIAFTKKGLYIISLNKKIKWLKFLFTSPLEAKK